MKNLKKDRKLISRDDVKELDRAAKTLSKKTGRAVTREEVSEAIKEIGNVRKDVYAYFIGSTHDI